MIQYQVDLKFPFCLLCNSFDSNEWCMNGGRVGDLSLHPFTTSNSLHITLKIRLSQQYGNITINFDRYDLTQYWSTKRSY